MPAYKKIKRIKDISERTRIIENILSLRAKLDREIPTKTALDTLILATWNIRKFGDNRLDESLHYIAEIISRFDLVAVQEVSTNLDGLQKLVDLLGHNWDYIVTDSTEGKSGGGERMAFVFDRAKILFRKVAGEIVLPADKLINQELQFARTPYSVAFQAGWFRFMLVTVHIYYGTAKKNDPRRLEEIKVVSEFLNKRAKKEDENYILLGDFNIFNINDDTMLELEKNGFYIPADLKKHPTNFGKNKYYDQIAFKLKMEPKMIVFSEENQHAGAFDFTDTIYTLKDLAQCRTYFDKKTVAGKTEKQIESYYLNNWRTFEISDHLPLWIELKVDFSNQHLEKIKKL